MWSVQIIERYRMLLLSIHFLAFLAFSRGAEVSREMGGRRAPRECKVQYARDYKAVTLKAFSIHDDK